MICDFAPFGQGKRLAASLPLLLLAANIFATMEPKKSAIRSIGFTRSVSGYARAATPANWTRLRTKSIVAARPAQRRG
jgi:hypothetical protein